MPKVTAKAGRLSDVIPNRRADWSQLNDLISKLEPGESLALECPSSTSLDLFRSIILNSGRRRHTGDWRVSTQTDLGKRIVRCFLIPAR
jgi:hypothetical protein